MGWQSVLAEGRAWLAAWRDLPNNPLAHYFRLTQLRKLRKIPAWRRWLPYILAVLLITLGVALPIAIQAIYSSYAGPNPQEMVEVLSGLGLAVVSAVYLMFMLAGIYETAISVMGLLSRPGLRNRGQVLDDMTAVTLLNDYEVVAATVRVYWPRLAWISLLGAGLTWLWLEFALMLDYFQDEAGPLLTAAFFGPVTIGAITISGAIAGVIYILWLLCAGRGLSNRLSASATGLIVALAHLVAVPLAVGFSVWIAVELTYNGTFSGPGFTSEVTAPAMTLALVGGFALALHLSEHWPAIRQLMVAAAPLLIPLSTVAVALLGNSIGGSGPAEQLSFEYFMSWRAFAMSSAVIGLPPASYGCWSYRAMDSAPLEWFRYPLLVFAQFAMAAIALYFARRAVHLRRSNLV